MRISDWSSDVCSSDLAGGAEAFAQGGRNDGPGSQFVRQLAARKTLALCAEDRDPVGVVDVEEEVVAFLKTHQRLERCLTTHGVDAVADIGDAALGLAESLERREGARKSVLTGKTVSV